MWFMSCFKSYIIQRNNVGIRQSQLRNYLFTIIYKTAVWSLASVIIKPRSHCPGVRPGASRQFTAGGPGRTGTNRDGIRVRSYIPGSATDQARLGAQIYHGMSP